MRVYHFVCARFGLEDIQHRRLKIARIADLNDPFEFIARADNPREREAIRAVKVTQSLKTGLLCFSKSWKNPVQWSHYADRHRGICLGFDVPDTLAKEITYRKSPLQFNRQRYISDNLYAQEFSELLVSTKFDDWKYEEEIRLFVKLDPLTETEGLYFYDFSEELRLREVIVGGASVITRKQVGTALGDISGNVVARKARLAFRSYRIVEQNNQSLWQ